MIAKLNSNEDALDKAAECRLKAIAVMADDTVPADVRQKRHDLYLKIASLYERVVAVTHDAWNPRPPS